MRGDETLNLAKNIAVNDVIGLHELWTKIYQKPEVSQALHHTLYFITSLQ
tara:strand:+ start:2540 stop:2689 length:150 start_codon:yes stop_codon:yes gene_type:complete